MSLNEPLIKEKIDRAVNVLLKNDLFLLMNNSDEWSISHKLAEYLQQEFPQWHVDLEYNRDKDQAKEMEGKIVRPDIIVHLRNTDNNLLIVEIKKSNNLGDLEDDKERLEKFTSPEGRYRYKLGLLIVFYVGADFQKAPTIEFYKKGKQL